MSRNKIFSIGNSSVNFRGRALLPLAGIALAFLIGLSPSDSAALDGHRERASAWLAPVWSGLSGCAIADGDDEAISSALDGDRVPSAGSKDYSGCGELALRRASGTMLLATMEDAVEYGGVALTGDDFQLHSSLGWDGVENILGEVDAVLPMLHNDAYGIFVQPGFSLWRGIDDENRVNANLGVVARAYMNPDVVVGSSIFLDYDFRFGHSRGGFGFDLQSGSFITGVNYYHPFSDWRAGRTGFEEHALQGADLRLGMEYDRLRFEGSLGLWRFQGEPGADSYNEASYGLEADWRVAPGIFLTGGVEQHHEDTLDTRWSTGVAFRFALPGFEGATGLSTSLTEPSLWRLAQREKRILYEERAAQRMVAFAQGSSSVTEGERASVLLTLSGGAPSGGLPLRVSVSGTATPGEDFTAPNATFSVPPGATSADIPIEITNDTDPENEETILVTISEGPDFPGSAWSIGTPETHTITILSSDNSVAFASETGMIPEAGGTYTAELELNSAAPPGGVPLNVAVSGTARGSGMDFSVPDRVAIAEGETSGSIDVTIIDDDISGEIGETIVLTISDGAEIPVGWSVGAPDTHTVTITDNDNTVVFALEDAVGPGGEIIEEGETVMLELTLTAPAPAGGLPLEIATSGTATSGGDYTPISAFTIPAEATSASIPVATTDDTIPEGDETVILTISAGENFHTDWDIGNRPATTITIGANDNTVAFAASTGTVSEGGGTYTAQINLNNAAFAGGLYLDVAYSGTAMSSGMDFTAPASVMIPAGMSTGAVDVTIIDDDIASEIGETIILTLSEGFNFPRGWTLVSPEAHTLTVSDNDNVVVFAQENTLGAGNSKTVEEGETVMVDVTLNAPAPSAGLPLAVTAAGTATSGADYAPIAEFTVPANMTSASIPVSITDDTVPENDETVILTLSGGTNFPGNEWRIGTRATNTIKIGANDNTVAFATASGGSREETDEIYTVDLVLNNAVFPGGLTLDVDVSGTATSGMDFFAPGTVTIQEGERTGSIDVTINDDDAPGEISETLVLTISESAGFPAGWSVADPGTHTLILNDNDTVVVFSQDNTTGTGGSMYVEEGETAMVELVLSAPAPSAGLPLAVSVSGTATSGADYAPISAFTVPANMTSARMPVSITDDTDAENDETVVLTISEGANFPGDDWRIGTRAANTVTIGASDNTVAFMTETGSISEAGGSYMAELALNNAVFAGGLTLSVAVSGTATGSGTDFTVPTTVAIPADSTAYAIDVTIEDDDVSPEIGETIILEISEGANFPRGWSVAEPDVHTVTIADNDNTVVFARDDTVAPGGGTIVEEGEELMVTLMLTDVAPPGGLPLAVAAAGTATSGDDYTPITAFTVPAGEMSGRFPVTIADDPVPENDETVIFTISEGVNFPGADWSIGSRSMHTITIGANDNTVAFVTATGDAIEEAETRYTVQLTLNNGAFPGGLPLAVTTSGTATSGLDFTVPTTIAIPAAATTHSFDVNIEDDEIPGEISETVILAISAGESFPRGWSVIAPETHTLTITDDDTEVVFASDNTLGADGGATVEEGETVVVQLELNAAAPAPGGLPLTIEVSGTAVRGSDYSLETAVLVPANNMLHSFNVTIADDAEVENDETIVLTVTEGTNFPAADWKIGARNTNTITIGANDGTVNFAMPASMVEEGDTAMVEVSLNSAAPTDLPLNVTVTGTATDGADFAAPATVTVSEGDRSADIMIRTVGGNDDEETEPDETVILTLSEGGGFPAGWELGDRTTHTVTILASDNTVEFAPRGESTAAASDSSTPEADNTTVMIPLTLTNNAPLGGLPLNVTVTGTAVSGTDFMAVASPFTVPEGVKAADISVRVINDDIAEDDETVILAISKGAGFSDAWGDIGMRTMHTLTILANDDTAGFATDVSILPAEATNHEVTIQATAAAPAGGLSFDVTLMGNSPDDLFNPCCMYQVTIPAGMRTATVTVTPIAQVTRPEAMFNLTLAWRGSPPSGWDLGTETHTLTVMPREVGFEMETSDLPPEAANHEVTIQANAAAPAGGLSFDVTLTGGRLPANDVFDPCCMFQATIPAGMRTATVTVAPIPQISRSAAMFDLTLAWRGTAPGGWNLGTVKHTITVVESTE